MCDEVTSGFGDDDAYLVAVGVNVKTGRTRSLSYGFPSMEGGESQTIPANQGYVFSDNVDDPRDYFVLGGVLEKDMPGLNVGIVVVGGENGTGKGLANHLQGEIDRLAKQYSGSVTAGTISRNVVKQALLQTFRVQIDQRKGKDDVIGIFTLDEGNGGFGYGHWRQRLTGDGAKYLATFKRVQNTGTIKKFIPIAKQVRFRVRDAYSKQTLAARVQIISKGKFLDNRRIQTDGKYEFSLPKGTYTARFTMKEPYISHKTLVLDQFTVGAGDYYKDVYLEPLHPGKHVPEPSIDLTGTWQAQVFGQTVTYQIQQTGSSFQWDAAQLGEKATGTLLANNQVSAQLHGPAGNQPPIQGRVRTDAKGAAVEIRWNNGVVFTRKISGSGGSQFPGGGANPGNGYDLAGVWRANVFGQSVRYDIQQSGGQFRWSAPQLNETASGEISGQQVSVILNGQFGSNSVTGTITKSHNGVATEIAWNNGVRFVRDQ